MQHLSTPPFFGALVVVLLFTSCSPPIRPHARVLGKVTPTRAESCDVLADEMRTRLREEYRTTLEMTAYINMGAAATNSEVRDTPTVPFFDAAAVLAERNSLIIVRTPNGIAGVERISSSWIQRFELATTQFVVGVFLSDAHLVIATSGETEPLPTGVPTGEPTSTSRLSSTRIAIYEFGNDFTISSPLRTMVADGALVDINVDGERVVFSVHAQREFMNLSPYAQNQSFLPIPGGAGQAIEITSAANDVIIDSIVDEDFFPEFRVGDDGETHTLTDDNCRSVFFTEGSSGRGITSLFRLSLIEGPVFDVDVMHLLGEAPVVAADAASALVVIQPLTSVWWLWGNDDSIAETAIYALDHSGDTVVDAVRIDGVVRTSNALVYEGQNLHVLVTHAMGGTISPAGDATYLATIDRSVPIVVDEQRSVFGLPNGAFLLSNDEVSLVSTTYFEFPLTVVDNRDGNIVGRVPDHMQLGTVGLLGRNVVVSERPTVAPYMGFALTVYSEGTGEILDVVDSVVLPFTVPANEQDFDKEYSNGHVRSILSDENTRTILVWEAGFADSAPTQIAHVFSLIEGNGEQDRLMYVRSFDILDVVHDGFGVSRSTLLALETIHTTDYGYIFLLTEGLLTYDAASNAFDFTSVVEVSNTEE